MSRRVPRRRSAWRACGRSFWASSGWVSRTTSLLSGDSLLATRLIYLVRDAFAAELPFRVLFEAPTVAALTAKILARGSGGAPEETLRAAVSQEEKLLEEVDDLSEYQLDSLLADLLAEGNLAGE